jgi:hypothetical protein
LFRIFARRWKKCRRRYRSSVLTKIVGDANNRSFCGTIDKVTDDKECPTINLSIPRERCSLNCPWDAKGFFFADVIIQEDGGGIESAMQIWQQRGNPKNHYH